MSLAEGKLLKKFPLRTSPSKLSNGINGKGEKGKALTHHIRGEGPLRKSFPSATPFQNFQTGEGTVFAKSPTKRNKKTDLVEVCFLLSGKLFFDHVRDQLLDSGADARIIIFAFSVDLDAQGVAVDHKDVLGLG